MFRTTTTATISSGIATVSVQAVSGGSNTNVPANTINVIVNPAAGITSVNNTLATSGGLDAETDDELRYRYYNSTGNPGASSTNSIRATLLKVDGVINALVRENKTLSTVGDLPGKCVAAVVQGGTDIDIANTLLNVVAGGMESYGSTIVEVMDDSGSPQNIGFSRPTIVGVWCNVSITTNDNFPGDGSQLVKTAIIKYIGGQDTDGTIYNGTGLGQSAVWTLCINAALSIPGITDISLTLSTDGIAFSTSNITITSLQVALTDSAKVVVS